jgi:hypothetical protein
VNKPVLTVACTIGRLVVAKGTNVLALVETNRPAAFGLAWLSSETGRAFSLGSSQERPYVEERGEGVRSLFELGVQQLPIGVYRLIASDTSSLSAIALAPDRIGVSDEVMVVNDDQLASLIHDELSEPFIDSPELDADALGSLFADRWYRRFGAYSPSASRDRFRAGQGKEGSFPFAQASWIFDWAASVGFSLALGDVQRASAGLSTRAGTGGTSLSLDLEVTVPRGLSYSVLRGFADEKVGDLGVFARSFPEAEVAWSISDHRRRLTVGIETSSTFLTAMSADRPSPAAYVDEGLVGISFGGAADLAEERLEPGDLSLGGDPQEELDDLEKVLRRGRHGS